MKQIQKKDNKNLAKGLEPTLLEQFQKAWKNQEAGKNITPEESAALKKMSGFNSCPSSFWLVGSIAGIANRQTKDKEAAKREVNRGLEMMAELKPEDGFEGMLITQMIMTFRQGMLYLEQASSSTNVDIQNSILNRSVKLMRLYNQQLETLDKHRRKGNQKMTVEHVNVHPGAQAIVGTVNQGEGGVKNEK